MRVLAAWILALGLAASPALAATSGGDKNSAATPSADKDAAAKAKDSGATKDAAKADASKGNEPAKAEPAKPAPAGMEGELQQLRDLIEAQSKQLQQQNDQLKEQQKKMDSLQEQLNASSPSRTGGAETNTTTPNATATAETANATNASAAEAVRAPAAAESSSRTITAAVTNTTPNKPASETYGTDQEGNPDQPASIHFKGVTLTPGGFMVAETAWRQRALSADVNTPFNSAPVPGSSQYNVSEFNASGRQSRISMLVQGKLSNAKIGGYYETDFLSAGTTSNSNQSNSYTLRQRQFWGQAALNNGWTFTGGQMWSLVTETQNGVDNRTEATPLTIDAQYTIGFTWARQYGFRIAKNFNNKAWLAMSVEMPQTTFAAHGQSSNFLFGAPGAGGGLYNTVANYSFNAAPDFIVKAVAQNKMAHLELFGVVSTFRDRVFATGASPYNDNRVGGGVGANARLWFFDKHMDLGVHGFVGDGEGRYGTGGLPDATVRPNGTLALIHTYQGLGTWEFHYPRFDLYMNVGGEYAGRTAFLTSSGAGEGYGSPLFNNSGCWTEPAPGSGGEAPGSVANCTADTRNLIEGTVGFWYRFYKGPMGTVQFGPQYSYYVRNTWYGKGSAGNPDGEPQPKENMFFTSFRYYLP